MMGLSEIIEANADPEGYARSSLSDGQARRESSGTKAYWSEEPAVLDNRPGSDWNDESQPLVMRDGAVVQEYVPAKRFQASPLPDVYFDAIKYRNGLEAVLRPMLHEHTRLLFALKAMRQNPDLQSNVDYLHTIIAELQALPMVKIGAGIEEAIATIDAKADPNPRGYTPRLALNYLFKPVRDKLLLLREIWIYGGM